MIAAVALILALGTSTQDAVCAPYFGSACSEAVGRWLPGNPVYRRISTMRAPATRVQFVTRFVYRASAVPHSWGVNAIGGTHFVYGSAGPPQGYGLYDSTNRLVFFEEGCCAWHQIVLAANASAPPMHFKNADLRSVRTTRGATIGMTVAQIRTRYGNAKLSTPPGNAGVAKLSYVRFAPYPGIWKQCEQDDDFVFENGKVVLIDIAEEC